MPAISFGRPVRTPAAGLKVGVGVPFSGANWTTASVSNTSAGNQGVGVFRGTVLDLERSDYQISEVMAHIQCLGIAGGGSGLSFAYVYGLGTDDMAFPSAGTAPLAVSAAATDLTTGLNTWKKWAFAGNILVPRYVCVGHIHNCAGGNPNWVQINATACQRNGPAALTTADPAINPTVLLSVTWTATAGYGATDTWASGTLTFASNQPVAWYLRRGA